MAFNDYMDHQFVLKSLVTTKNSIGEIIESYSSGTGVDARLYPLRGNMEEIGLGRTKQNDRYRLYLKATEDWVTIKHRASVINAQNIVPASTHFDIVHVNPIPGGNGLIHHMELDVQKVD